MNVIQALVLGLLQGLTEFIPVSSSGHLVLVPWLFGWPAPSMAFDTVLHLGTLAAILGFFWRDYVSLLRAAGDSIRRRSLDVPQSRLAWALVIGTIPAALLGYVAADWFEELFAAPAWVGVFLIMTGWLLLAGEAWAGRLHSATLEKMGAGVALLVGLAQGIAIAPGFSRAGATISTGRLLGLPRHDAARFSFLLAAPIIAGAGALQIVKLVELGVDSTGALSMAVGFAAAVISGYLVIRLLLSYLRRHSVMPFVIYCWVAGLATLGIWLLRLPTAS